MQQMHLAKKDIRYEDKARDLTIWSLPESRIQCYTSWAYDLYDGMKYYGLFQADVDCD